VCLYLTREPGGSSPGSFEGEPAYNQDAKPNQPPRDKHNMAASNLLVGFGCWAANSASQEAEYPSP
jgi:hypothetical protein